MVVDGQFHTLAILPSAKVMEVKEDWMGFMVWSGRVQKNLSPTGFRTPDRPDSSQPLYRLLYSGPWKSIFGKPRRRWDDVRENGS